MAGGLIAMQRARGVDVHVLAVTDGEAAYDVSDPSALGQLRGREQLAALRELGVQADSVTRLSLPDGAVADHHDELVDAIAALDEFGLVVAPWTGDHHCDHEAAGDAATVAASATGAALMYGLFWTWHRRGPDDLAGELVMAVRLGDDAMDRRRQAVNCHRSQFSTERGSAQLTDELVEPVEWAAEFFVAPQPPVESPGRSATRASLVGSGVAQVTSGRPWDVQA